MLPGRAELSEKTSSRKKSVTWGRVNILVFLHLYSDFVFTDGAGVGWGEMEWATEGQKNSSTNLRG